MTKRSNNDATVAKYEHDALGRRVQSVEYMDAATGEMLATARKIRHVYVGIETVEEYEITGENYEETAALVREFLWGDPGQFPEPLAMVTHGGAFGGLGGPGVPAGESVFHYLHDVLGSVVGLTDSAGVFVERYTYDPYGRTYVEASDGQGGWTGGSFSVFGNPFAWTGQRYEPVTGLYSFLFRTYSPSLGRWLQRDPIGYASGSINLYEYVLGSPLDLMDPFGLDDEEPPSGGGGGSSEGDGKKECDKDSEKKDDNPTDPSDGSPIKRDPDDPCHRRCTGNEIKCKKRGYSISDCTADGNRCVRACNRARKSYDGNNDPLWKRWGVRVADEFWRVNKNCRTLVVGGHIIIGSDRNEMANEREIARAIRDMNKKIKREKFWRTVRHYDVKAGIVILSALRETTGVVARSLKWVGISFRGIAMNGVAEEILEWDGDDDPEVRPYGAEPNGAR